MQQVDLSSIDSLVNTGDVVAFSGNSSVSRLIKIATHSIYSHVAIVIKNVIDGQPPVLLVESTTINEIPDLLTQKKRKGVQIVTLKDKVNCYQGDAYLLTLTNPLLEQERAGMVQWLLTIHADQVRYDLMQGVRAILEHGAKCLDNTKSLKRLFCSELVSEALRIANRIDPDINSSDQLPRDVVNFTCLNRPIFITKEKHEEVFNSGCISVD